MKKILAALVVLFLIIPILLTAQETRDKKDSTSTLSSKAIEEKGQSFDKQILELNKRIQDVVANEKMMTSSDIRTLPYQTEIIYGPDEKNPKYVQIVRHIYIKDGLFSTVLIGYEEKTLRIYSDGKTVSQVETIIKTKNFESQDQEVLIVLDTSPATESTDDIQITHSLNGRKLLEQKKLGDILNNTDTPIRNEIKSDFIIPNLTILHENLLFITESNKKDAKDADVDAAEFLKKSTSY